MNYDSDEVLRQVVKNLNEEVARLDERVKYLEEQLLTSVGFDELIEGFHIEE